MLRSPILLQSSSEEHPALNYHPCHRDVQVPDSHLSLKTQRGPAINILPLQETAQVHVDPHGQTQVDSFPTWLNTFSWVVPPRNCHLCPTPQLNSIILLVKVPVAYLFDDDTVHPIVLGSHDPLTELINKAMTKGCTPQNQRGSLQKFEKSTGSWGVKRPSAITSMTA